MRALYAIREAGGRRRNELEKCKNASFVIHPSVHVHSILFYRSVVVVVVFIVVVVVVVVVDAHI